MAPATALAASISGTRAVAATAPNVLPIEPSVPPSCCSFSWKPVIASRAVSVAPLVLAIAADIRLISSSLWFSRASHFVPSSSPPNRSAARRILAEGPSWSNARFRVSSVVSIGLSVPSAS